MAAKYHTQYFVPNPGYTLNLYVSSSKNEGSVAFDQLLAFYELRIRWQFFKRPDPTPVQIFGSRYLLHYCILMINSKVVRFII